MFNKLKNLWAKLTIPDLEHRLESAARTLRMLNESTYVGYNHFKTSDGEFIRERVSTEVVYKVHPLIEKYGR